MNTRDAQTRRGKFVTRQQGIGTNSDKHADRPLRNAISAENGRAGRWMNPRPAFGLVEDNASRSLLFVGQHRRHRWQEELLAGCQWLAHHCCLQRALAPVRGIDTSIIDVNRSRVSTSPEPFVFLLVFAFVFSITSLRSRLLLVFTMLFYSSLSVCLSRENAIK